MDKATNGNPINPTNLGIRAWIEARAVAEFDRQAERMRVSGLAWNPDTDEQFADAVTCGWFLSPTDDDVAASPHLRQMREWFEDAINAYSEHCGGYPGFEDVGS